MPEYGGGFPGPGRYPVPPQPQPRPGTAALARRARLIYQQQQQLQLEQQQQIQLQQQLQQQQQPQGSVYPPPQLAAAYAQGRVMAQVGHPPPPSHDDLSPVYDPFGYLESHDLTMGAVPRQRAGNAVHGGGGGASSSFSRLSVASLCA